LGLFSAEREQARETFAENRGGGDKAEDDIAFGRKIVEVTGMHKDVMVAEEMDSEVFIRGTIRMGMRAKTEDSVPSGVGIEEFGGGLRLKTGLQMGAIFVDARKELGTKRVALGEKRRQSSLRGSAEREVDVGNDFETLERGADV